MRLNAKHGNKHRHWRKATHAVKFGVVSAVLALSVGLTGTSHDGHVAVTFGDPSACVQSQIVH